MPIHGPALSKPAMLTDLLASALATKSDDVALQSGSQTWTWRELQRDVEALASGLHGMGLRPGDRIASLMPNRAELLLFYLSALRAGLVVTPLNYRYTPPEIDYALEVSGAVALCAGAERNDDIRASALARGLPKGLISFGGKIDGAQRFDDLLATANPLSDLGVTDMDTPAFLFFTSGSTGKPKGVTHSLVSFGSIAASFSQALQLSAEDIVLPGGSIAHVGSLSAALSALWTGSTVVIPHSFDGGEILSLLRRHRPTVLVMLPASFIAMERDARARPEDFACLRLCVTGGDKFPDVLAKEFTEKTGIVIQEAYGLTEATDCLFNQSTQPVKAGSVGTVTPGFIASLRDANGSEVATGVDGNLWLSGPPVMIGYWQNPAATNAAFDQGWFDTGDVMQVDEEGYFWFRGRKKQIIVHDGSNIAPQEIEEAVMSHPSVELAGVIGVRNELHGENVWAYVTIQDGQPAPNLQEIIDHARQRVGYKAPERIVVLDEMPLNATGKIDRTYLKRLAEHSDG